MFVREFRLTRLKQAHAMQIRTHLSEAGLDPASNNGTRECIQDAKKALDEKNRDEGGTPDKSGTLALTFLESLMGVLTLVYGMVEQGPDASAASDFRLVVSSWKEEPATRARYSSRDRLRFWAGCA